MSSCANETFTLDELECLYEDVCNAEGGNITAIVDGVCYETDWGYGLEGIEHFLVMLKRRHGIEVDV